MARRSIVSSDFVAAPLSLGKGNNVELFILSKILLFQIMSWEFLEYFNDIYTHKSIIYPNIMSFILRKKRTKRHGLFFDFGECDILDLSSFIFVKVIY